MEDCSSSGYRLRPHGRIARFGNAESSSLRPNNGNDRHGTVICGWPRSKVVVDRRCRSGIATTTFSTQWLDAVPKFYQRPKRNTSGRSTSYTLSCQFYTAASPAIIMTNDMNDMAKMATYTSTHIQNISGFLSRRNTAPLVIIIPADNETHNFQAVTLNKSSAPRATACIDAG